MLIIILIARYNLDVLSLFGLYEKIGVEVRVGLTPSSSLSSSLFLHFLNLNSFNCCLFF